MEFNIIIKGVRYQLKAYKELRDEWDLIVDGRLICDSRSYSTCMKQFLNMVED